jgi:YHS domain-containing protein
VQLRAAGKISGGMVDVAPAEEVVDPVCGMTVDPARSPHRTEHDGRSWWFCSESCLASFEKDPGSYTAPKQGAGRGR